MKKAVITLSITLAVVLGFSFQVWALGLNLDKNVYGPGENIQVNFTAPANYAKDAWVGVIPANIPHGSESQNDQHDLAYKYLEGQTSGTIVFAAPATPGSFDVRMHTTDNNGQEVASVTFTVAGATVSGDTLKLDKSVYSPGENIRVTFTASPGYPRNAWMGVIPSNIPHGDESQNDKYDVAYHYLEGKTSGTMVFVAPPPGSYDVRLNTSDSNGKEVASVTFQVK